MDALKGRGYLTHLAAADEKDVLHVQVVEVLREMIV